MMQLLLFPIPILFYHLYSTLVPSEKLSAGHRILLDLFTSFTFSFLIYYLSSPYTSPPDFLSWLGFTLTVENYGAMLSCSSVILVLFIGPLVQTAFIEDEGPEFNLPELKIYVTDAFVQELVFRTCTINLLLACGFGFTGSMALCAGIFMWSQCYGYFKGLTWQNAVKHGKIGQVVEDVVRQLVFGGMLAYMFLRTGSYLAVVIVHVFKNFMGFPDFGFFFQSHKLCSYRIIIAMSYIVGLIGGSYLFNLILMDPELFSPWFTSLY